jgi:hypothetical protein
MVLRRLGGLGRRLPARLVLLALACASTPAPAAALGLRQYFPPVPRNPADRILERPLEDYRYDFARRCRERPTAGALALEAWLERNAAGESWGIMRCEKLGRRNYSLHAEGRALDWHLDARVPAERRAGESLISLLLAEDRGGNPNALARRMGIQEIIWDCKAWWAGSEGLVRYSACYGRNGERRRHVDATMAHRDHVHIGLNWAGARKRTSFWTE